jgi:alkylation response protein AidB-like acyl-CoA dehydrogenase
MDFTIPERMQIILEMTREFMEKEVLPLEPHFVGKKFRDMAPEIRRCRDMVKKMELWGPQIARDLGGMGLTLVEHALMSEVLGESPLGHLIFGCQAPDAGNIEILERYGTERQREEFLMPLAKGEIRSCFSMCEPEFAGSNPTEMATTAVRDGDLWVINGHKWFTSSADGARFAIVMAVTDPEAPSYLRASMIIVPTDTPGFHRVRNVSVMGHAGDDYASHGEILYRDCRVPAENLLGPQGQGFVIAQERLGPGRIHHCMRWIGICNRSFDMMCRRVTERKVGGGKTLAQKQIMQEWIAECRAEIHAARLMVLHAAWKIENEGQYAAREEVSMIKFFVAPIMLRVVDRAIQAHGALGVSDDTILSFFYRQERAARIYDGPDEVHKVVLSRRILRDYGEKQT